MATSSFASRARVLRIQRKSTRHPCPVVVGSLFHMRVERHYTFANVWRAFLYGITFGVGLLGAAMSIYRDDAGTSAVCLILTIVSSIGMRSALNGTERFIHDARRSQ